MSSFDPLKPPSPASPMRSLSREAAASGDYESVVIADMRLWLERAVIGLNLCPFAKSVHVKEQVHYVVSDARDPQVLRAHLVRELRALHAADPAVRDTTLLMAPFLFSEFLDFNDFLAEAEDALAELGLEGELQIASFHPDFLFAGTDASDVTNYTNRAPYPTLHLLREASIDRAVDAYPQAETIYERNMKILQEMGVKGWEALGIRNRLRENERDDPDSAQERR